MKKILLHTILILGVATSFTSCLKDKGFEDGEYGIPEIGDGKNLPKVIEIPSAGSSPVTFALNTLPATETIGALEVNLALGVPATEDIQVTLVKNMTIVADFNTANGTSYVELPANCYTLPASGLVITIPKGKNRTTLNLNLIKSNFDFSLNYALGYSIASVSPAGYVISQNYKNLMITVGLKNKYDGAYLLTGVHNRPPASSYGFPYINVPMEMHTSGSSNIKFFFNAVNSYGHPIGVGATTLSWYGASVAPQLNIDPVTNSITAVVGTGAGGPPIDADPSVTTHRVTWNAGANRPDKIYVSWRYNANQDRRFFDTLTYVGPR